MTILAPSQCQVAFAWGQCHPSRWQMVITVDPATTVGQVLRLLEDNRSWQVPVARRVEVLGSFSYRSFARRAVLLQQGHGPRGASRRGVPGGPREIAHVTEELASMLDHDDVAADPPAARVRLVARHPAHALTLLGV